MPHPQLAHIPDALLDRTPGSPGATSARARRLAAWCAAHGFRPTLLDIETERNRRRTTHA